MRKIEKYIRGKKAAAVGVNWKLISAILVALVVIIVIFGLWKFEAIDKLKNLFPDFEPGGGGGEPDDISREISGSESGGGEEDVPWRDRIQSRDRAAVNMVARQEISRNPIQVSKDGDTSYAITVVTRGDVERIEGKG